MIDYGREINEGRAQDDTFVLIDYSTPTDEELAAELDMTVDDALKYIISMGVVAPPLRKPAPRAALLNE